MQGDAARARRWLADWDEQGWHRTGTPSDAHSADWLEGIAREAGASIRSEPASLDRVEVLECWLRAGGTTIEGLPLFDAPGSLDLQARLSDDGHGPLSVARVAPDGMAAERFAEERRSTRTRGLVVVTEGQQPGLALLNAPAFGQPYGPPGIQIGSEHANVIRDWTQQQLPVEVKIRTRRVPCVSRNVVAVVEGQDPDLASVAVLTPRTSWWTSTAERAGGIVAWIEALRATAAGRPRRTTEFVATFGHELGHLGLQHHLRRRVDVSGPPDWLHLGANLGAVNSTLTVLSPSGRLRALLAASLPQVRIDESGRRPRSEARNIHDAGHRYVSIVGTSTFFHLPQDRLAVAVDVEAVGLLAGAVAAAVVALGLQP